MPTPADPLEELRADLRALYRAAPCARWEARIDGDHVHLYRVAADGGRWLVAMPNRAADARLAAGAVNAVPLLFAEIDRLRASSRGVPILGTVG